MAITPEDFGASFKDFLDQMRAQKKPEDDPFFVRRLRGHFDAEPAGLPVVSESFARHDHPNIHLALEDCLAREGRSSAVIGVSGQAGYMGRGLADLVGASNHFGGGAVEGPVQYTNVGLDGERVLACVERGLFLVNEGDRRLGVFVREEDKIGERDNLVVEVMAQDRASAERFLGELREAMRVRNVYRGYVLSLREEGYRDLKVKFHRLPVIDREAIILPEGLLERIERQTVGFSRHRDRLRGAGRHLKRGLLLHGPPGTGKTLTIMYL
ncbi:MAG TPA: hypothetical protein VGH33_22350, partial [Isosphaeraceae bacterium]